MRLIFIRALDIRGSSGADPDDLQRMFEYVFDGPVESIVQETMPLDDYEQAYRMMTKRELYGKVVLTQE
jgi:D-arabinose 1-dehydrogenase-like Zn-dependent alcohol dehydrogenase